MRCDDVTIRQNPATLHVASTSTIDTFNYCVQQIKSGYTRQCHLLVGDVIAATLFTQFFDGGVVVRGVCARRFAELLLDDDRLLEQLKHPTQLHYVTKATSFHLRHHRNVITSLHRVTTATQARLKAHVTTVSYCVS